VSNVSSAPDCAAECRGLVLRLLRLRGVDAHVTHVPPLVRTPYKPLDMRCPHDVLWYVEPTSEQIAEWAREGVA